MIFQPYQVSRCLKHPCTMRPLHQVQLQAGIAGRALTSQYFMIWSLNSLQIYSRQWDGGNSWATILIFWHVPQTIRLLVSRSLEKMCSSDIIRLPKTSQKNVTGLPTIKCLLCSMHCNAKLEDSLQVIKMKSMTTYH